MHKFLLNKISTAIEKDITEAKLFYLGNLDTLATIKYNDYDKVLNDAMAFFIKTEQYELAEKCKQSITTHTIEKLIKSVK